MPHRDIPGFPVMASCHCKCTNWHSEPKLASSVSADLRLTALVQSWQVFGSICLLEASEYLLTRHPGAGNSGSFPFGYGFPLCTDKVGFGVSQPGGQAWTMAVVTFSQAHICALDKGAKQAERRACTLEFSRFEPESQLYHYSLCRRVSPLSVSAYS